MFNSWTQYGPLPYRSRTVNVNRLDNIVIFIEACLPAAGLDLQVSAISVFIL
jgi:hypothetical protein